MAKQHGHVAHEGTYATHGSLICDRIDAIPPGDRMDLTYATYYAMGRCYLEDSRFPSPMPMRPRSQYTLHGETRSKNMWTKK